MTDISRSDLDLAFSHLEKHRQLLSDLGDLQAELKRTKLALAEATRQLDGLRREITDEGAKLARAQVERGKVEAAAHEAKTKFDEHTAWLETIKAKYAAA